MRQDLTTSDSTRLGRRKSDESFRISALQVGGVALLFAALLALLLLFPDRLEFILGVAVAAVGAGKLVVGHLEAHENDELPPASRAFRELADPTRPLAADDPVSTTRAEAGTAAARPRNGE